MKTNEFQTASMTLFIYEHLTSGALADEAISPSLLQEGEAMLAAICHDIAALGCHITVMRDSRLPALSDSTGLISTVWVDSPATYRQIWQQSLNQFQQFLIIAPETNGLLGQLVTELEQRQKHHLGSSAGAIKLCTDKLLSSQWLIEHGIATPRTVKSAAWLKTSAAATEAGWIIKPQDGAGCEQTFRMSAPQARSYLKSLAPSVLEQQIVQPYIEGTPLSLSLLITDSDIQVLSVNRQHIEESDHQLHLSRCEAGQQDLIKAAEASRLTQQIHATIPGLWGFVGIDLVQSHDALWLIEINPRLTVSYAEAALRQGHNPALSLQPYLQED
jgi:predicted ATP-grasp superfamily ATP-dependent carboligase